MLLDARHPDTVYRHCGCLLLDAFCWFLPVAHTNFIKLLSCSKLCCLCPCAQILPPASSCPPLTIAVVVTCSSLTLIPVSGCCFPRHEHNFLKPGEKEGDRQQLRGRPQTLLDYSRHGKVVHLSDCAMRIWHQYLVRELANCHRHSAVGNIGMKF